jgi:DNA-directed RNA polymerase specialized sigma24 family protein
MARDGVLTNRGNFLDEVSLKELISAAEIYAWKYPHISKEEFIQIGWLRIIRFDRSRDPHDLRRRCLQCFRRYAAERWKKLEGEHTISPEGWEVLEVVEETDPAIGMMAEEYLAMLEDFPEDKHIILSRLYFGMSWPEIGNELGITRTATFERYKRAIKRLRERVGVEI